jgi:hypothetical protein
MAICADHRWVARHRSREGANSPDADGTVLICGRRDERVETVRHVHVAWNHACSLASPHAPLSHPRFHDGPCDCRMRERPDRDRQHREPGHRAGRSTWLRWYRRCGFTRLGWNHGRNERRSRARDVRWGSGDDRSFTAILVRALKLSRDRLAYRRANASPR